MLKIGFFFGAGAESNFGLPSGGTYTKETMITKRSELYKALESFYEERLSDDYASSYRSEFLFRKDSLTFWKIVYDAAVRCKVNRVTVGPLSESEKLIINWIENNDAYSDDVVKDFKDTFENRLGLFKTIIKDSDYDDQINIPEYSNLINEFKYYGTVEKDFSTIIAPKDAGINRFWRLINYFWSAYFSIVIPIISKNDKYKEALKNNLYDYVLKNLEEITGYIYSDEFLGQDDHNNYYQVFKKEFDICCAMTTNYTPYIRNLGIGNNKNDRYAFLAGELALFEIPNELRVVDLRNEFVNSSALIFPFLFTQAPVKPIVEPRHIKEYAKAIDFLEEIDCLVVVGYSLGSSDNHINALMRDFVIRPNKKFVFCEYSKQGSVITNEALQRIKRSLKIQSNNADNIFIVENNGDAFELSNRIKTALCQMHKP